MESRNIVALEDVESYKKFINENNFVIIKAEADWCGPCQRIKPLFKKLLNGMPSQLSIGIIDISKSPKLKSFLRIRAVPLIFNVINGEVKDIINTSKENQIISLFSKTLRRIK